MKKQISILVALVSFLSLTSCQKENINTGKEMDASAALSVNAKQLNNVATPFKGSFVTALTVLHAPPSLVQRVTGTGTASHLGESTFDAISNVTVNATPPFAVSGTRTITAANGDQLFSTFTGTSTPVINGMNGADLQDVITGGTGRFANATGSFTTTSRNNFITSTFTADFDGVINY
jgi:hypothetical protein